jgi:hypothetical protein
MRGAVETVFSGLFLSRVIQNAGWREWKCAAYTRVVADKLPAGEIHLFCGDKRQDLVGWVMVVD